MVASPFFKIFSLLAMLAAFLIVCTGCTAIQSVSEDSPSQRSLLELRVDPPTAEIYLDDAYQGVVKGWSGQTMPIQPGYRRLELRASGFITQRFDLQVETNQHLVLTVRMEPQIGSFDETEDADSPGDDAPETSRPEPPPHPSLN